MNSTGIMVLRTAVFLSGIFIIGGTLVAAIKTFIMPRGVNVWLTRVVFRSIGFFFRLRVKRATYEERDRIMAFFPPLALFLMPMILLVLILLGYILLFWALEPRPLPELFYLSGSSLLTLGYASVNTVASKLLEFSEAMIGLVLIAMLIAYLPTMYSAFSRRETAVVLWESRAGSPPTVAEMVSRSYRTGELERLRDVWMSWQTWFAELEESHTSLSPLVFFRSPQPQRSWITAAGSVMDSAAFILAAVDVPFDPQAAFCIRSGFLALRQIADFFKLPHESNPRPDMPISISRYEFDKVCQELVAQNVPIRADRDLAWKNFVGWRVNYDDVLLRLAALTSAPYAPWVSDRSALIRTAKRKP
ncbi:MAG: hypothetical protein H6654_11745 [Ardenticatenaceae bacterium]|nr:hypothetical protein [Anaerolineales bacterium]MCB8937653.1 hypothetical protein [Ardenticatenaceae bacterium]MCB8974222.1 hypothetical protein [Ardenticatenaceae bacterium]